MPIQRVQQDHAEQTYAIWFNSTFICEIKGLLTNIPGPDLTRFEALRIRVICHDASRMAGGVMEYTL